MIIKHDKSVHCSFTQDQFKIMNDYAKSNGLSVPQFIRLLVCTYFMSLKDYENEQGDQ